MKNDKVATIIRAVVADIIKPVVPIAIQAMNETELLILIMSSRPAIGRLPEALPSEVIEAYSALRRINSVKYRDIDFKMEAEKLGITTEEPYFWERPENKDITPGAL